MKKLLLTVVCLILSTTFINATEVKKIYMDTEVEIAGGLHVKEIVYVDSQTEDFNLKIYYKDKSLKEFKENKASLYSSYIYNAHGIKLFKVGIVDDEKNVKEYNTKDFFEKHVKEVEYEVEDTKEYYILKFPKNNEDNIYYLEYTVLNILVEHNDSAELYFKFINNFDYDVDSISVITTLPAPSKLFKVWAHGSKNMKVSLDKENSIVYSEITNYKKGEYLDNRILFDKEIFSLNINSDKKSNMDAIKIIEDIEKERISNTKKNNILELSLIICTVILIILIFMYALYIKTKKRKKR